MIVDSSISILKVIITIVGNAINIDNTSIVNMITYIRITSSVIMYATTVMNINMNSIGSVTIIIDNMAVTINNTINHHIIGIKQYQY